MAQWLAQGTHNSLVGGSNPPGPTFQASFLGCTMGDKLEEKTNTKYGNLEITVEGMDEIQLAELMGVVMVGRSYISTDEDIEDAKGFGPTKEE
jgi:hypothetical protein